MTEPRHTRGPWEYVAAGGADGDDIHHLVFADDGAVELCEMPTMADALLVSAAPDLLAACEEYIAYQRGAEACVDDILGRMKAAIVKAKGAAR